LDKKNPSLSATRIQILDIHHWTSMAMAKDNNRTNYPQQEIIFPTYFSIHISILATMSIILRKP